MSKALVLVFALVACTFAAGTFDQIKEIVQKDECGVHAMETLRPKMENKIQELKQVKYNLTQEPQRP